MVSGEVVKWDIGSEVSGSGKAGIGLEAELGLALQATYGKDYETSTETGVGWDLPANPGEWMEYEIEWREIWQPGVAIIQTGNEREIISYEYRRAIQTDILSKTALDCPNQLLEPQDALSDTSEDILDEVVVIETSDSGMSDSAQIDNEVVPPTEIFIPLFDPQNTTELNPVFGWHPGESTASSYNFTIEPGKLTLVAGGQTNQWKRENSQPMLILPVSGNFTAQARVDVSGQESYQIAGIGIKSKDDITTWARIHSGYNTDRGVYSNSTNAGEYVGNSSGHLYSDSIVYLRVRRQGPIVRTSYSHNGINWVELQDSIVLNIDPSGDVDLYLFAISAGTDLGTVAHFDQLYIYPE